MKIRTIFQAGLAMLLLIPRVQAQTQNSGKETALIEIKSQGKVQGMRKEDGSLSFQGIPYAAPPVGPLRWREPQSPQPWNGVRDASIPPPACMQMDWGWNREDAQKSSEDCLYLSIATPSPHPAKPLPVMFWIHGGANYNGSGRSIAGQTLTKHGVVLVSINYRLGVFGFLAHPELTAESPHRSSGNYALLDQIQALRWVQENIAAFGGDPANITIFGQSAGAMNVGMLLVSPLSRGIFQRAIDESGGPILPAPILPSLTAAEDTGSALAEFSGFTGTGQLAKLRQLPAKQLLEIVNRLTAPDAEGVPTRPGPNTNVDGWILPMQPAAAVLSLNVADVPYIIGSNIQEFTFARSSVISSAAPAERAAALRQRIEAVFGSDALKAIALYGLDRSDHPAPDPLRGSAGTQLMTDSYFRCPAATMSEWLSASGRNVWEYSFEHPLPGSGSPTTRHGGEVPYVFGAAQDPHSKMMGATFGDFDAILSEQMQVYWTNFAKQGNPNGDGVPPWAPYKERKSEMRFTSQGPVLDQGHTRPVCDLYEHQLAIELKQ